MGLRYSFGEDMKDRYLYYFSWFVLVGVGWMITKEILMLCGVHMTRISTDMMDVNRTLIGILW